MMESSAPAVVLDSHAHVVRSSIVGDDYQLSVWMPPGYASSENSYPVVYVLDGSMTFGFAAQATMLSIFGEVVPEALVVGIGRSQHSAYEPGPSRARDFSSVPLPGDDESGHADSFAHALRNELLPYIDDRYRTDKSDRTLWGHSLGGVFALRLLLTEPALFQRVIATSPSVVHEGRSLVQAGDWPAAGNKLEARVFTSVGSADDLYRPHVEAFNDELRARDYLALRFETELLPGYGHIAAAPVGFLAGLRSVFQP